MVSGQYFPLQAHEELGDYVRPDYIEADGWGNAVPPCPAEMPPPGSEPVAGAPGLLDPSNDSFLVRLRRTRNVDGLDDIPDVSTSSVPLPLLFGRGSMIQADPSSGFNVRAQGLTVRGTAIAQARPAMRVGLPLREAGVPGAMSFAVTRTFASTFTNGEVITIDAGGHMTVAGDIVGQFAADAMSIATVGNELVPAPPGPCDPAAVPQELTYVPVFDLVGLSATNRIIGFVAARLTWPVCVGTSAPAQVTIGHGPHGVALSNATAFLIDGLSDTLPPSDIAAIMTAARELAEPPISVGVQAPAVVR
jgi:hypothetical protein